MATRRALAVETGLLQIQSEIMSEPSPQPTADVLFDLWLGRSKPSAQPQADCDEDRASDFSETANNVGAARPAQNANNDIARCFLRLANVDNGAFERLSRYETALCRQVGQTLLMLEVCSPAGSNGAWPL